MPDFPKPPLWRPINATSKAVFEGANRAIESAYREHKDRSQPVPSYLLGWDFDRNQRPRLPKGAPNKKFGDALLDDLYGLANPRQPDIVDFLDRTYFEIKPVATYMRKPIETKEQLASLYRLTEPIRVKFWPTEEPEWAPWRVTWRPPDVLAMPGNPRQVIVTTLSVATYERDIRGLIVYQVWERTDRRKDVQNVAVITVTDRDRRFSGLLPQAAEIAKLLGYFDPDDPNYVVIVPRRIAEIVTADEQVLQKYSTRVPPFIDRKHPIGQLRDVMRLGPATPYAEELGLIAQATALALGYSGLLMAFTGGAIYVVGGGAAAGGAAAGGGGAAVIQLASRRLASEAMKAAAGILVTIGTVASVSARNIEFSAVDFVRVVPEHRLTPYRTTLSGTSSGMAVSDPADGFPTADPTVNAGDTVMFDSEPHVVAAKLRAG